MTTYIEQYCAYDLYMNYIKNGQVKLNMLNWAKLFVKYIYKKPDDVNIFYEKLRSF